MPIVTIRFRRHSSSTSLGGMPKMKLKAGTPASSNTLAWSSKRAGTYALYSGRGAPSSARWAASGARHRLNARSSDVRAPSSSIDTHRFIANGLVVRERTCAITSLIRSGARLCAPNDPSPPKLETAAVNRCDDKPPRGP